MGSRRLLLLALVAFAAAICGVFIGRVIADRPRASETELHALLHGKLELTAQQQVEIDSIEARFAVRRKALDLEMRAANARLAEAIESEHGFGPKVTAAIDHSHVAMGELQKETLEHLLAMRAVLNPEQAKMFDSTVVKALTADAR
ncbi:MAG: periplasmic heavy metal sensor [Novosphingobium sp.]|nr:periplasmic heavy metal sensor [Novosphingobium sp.]